MWGTLGVGRLRCENRPASIIWRVRLLLLSDVHGNLEALEACLDAAPDYDSVANLGDVVGYGGSPNQTVELIRALGAINVRGNHDRCCCGLEDTSDFNPLAAAAALWTRNELSYRNQDWLRALPRGPVRDEAWPGVEFVHGSPLDEDEYIVSAYVAQESLRSPRSHLTFFGHTHIQGTFGRPRGVAELLPPEPLSSASRAQLSRLPLDPRQYYLVNPGSVGQPRDRDRRAAFALYDSDEREVLFYRVPYDIGAAQERILMAGLPKMLALRLDEGR
jgi:diadenosine tetraphosphatase ApaH/serine/threonine PP2A family protein phosphatase